MDKFFDRFKPKNKGSSSSNNNNNNLFSNLRLPGQKQPNSFGGEGKSLGGSLPGRVIPIELKEPGPLGIQVERRPNSAGTAIVSMVVDHSQAAAAGIQRGDILCFAGSNGAEEIMYDMFLELAKSTQRPLCFEVRRVQTKTAAATTTATTTGGECSESADEFARKQAVIAAAEAREKAHKKQMKPMAKNKTSLPVMLSTAERHKLEEERLARLQQTDEPKSEAARQAIEHAKRTEAQTAASLGYNPYETKKATAGQARVATVAMTHGAMDGSAAAASSVAAAADMPRLPAVRAPPAAVTAATDDSTAAHVEVLPPEYQEAYEHAVTLNDHAIVVNSFGILRKLIVNATTKGQLTTDPEAAAKFRRVRLSNAKIKNAVVDTQGALEIMLAAGFQLQEEDGESILMYPAGNKGPVWLEAALRQMERYESS